MSTSTAPSRTAPSVVLVLPIIAGAPTGAVYFPADSSGRDDRRAVIAFFRRNGHDVQVEACSSEEDYLTRHPDVGTSLCHIDAFPSHIEPTRIVIYNLIY